VVCQILQLDAMVTITGRGGDSPDRIEGRKPAVTGTEVGCASGKRAGEESGTACPCKSHL
jgi:hypothetical protein